MLTLPDDPTMAVDEEGVVLVTDGVTVGIPNKIDDHANTTSEDNAKSTTEDFLGRSEIKRHPEDGMW